MRKVAVDPVRLISAEGQSSGLSVTVGAGADLGEIHLTPPLIAQP
jgi:hypothetical protein